MSEPATLREFLTTRMDSKGIESARGLGRHIGVSPETARQLLNGETIPNETTLRKIADGFGGSLPQLRRLTGHPEGERTPFVLPPEADQLNQRQREVILKMVWALLEASAGNLT